MDELLEEIQDYLDSESLGTKGVDLFISNLPASPDNAIGVFEGVGLPVDKYVPKIRKPGFQVMVRNTSYKTGKALIESIFDKLNNRNDSFEFKSGGIDVMRIDAEGEPQQMPSDENGRYLFLLNFIIWIRND